MLPFRGGDFGNGVGAGVFALNFNNPRSNSNINVGFRAALPSQPDIQSLRTLFQCGGDKGVCSLPTILLVVAKIKLPWKPPVTRKGKRRDTWPPKGENNMKSIKHIKERVTDYENLYTAYLHARRCKRYRDEVLQFSANLEDNLHYLQQSLRDQTYRPGPYAKKVIHDPVDRLIMWQAFIHRVVQWAVYQIINPAFVQGYIEDSYACIPGRGADAAAQRLFYFMEQAGRLERRSGFDAKGKPRRRFYFQKLDTSKFFYRIDHAVSLDLIGRKCNYDPWLMWLMDLFVNAPGEKFGYPPGKGIQDIAPEDMVADKGLAVGSLLNQMLANVNQNEVDQFAKRTLRIHYYVRYMDDIVMLADDKDQLMEWRNQIGAFMEERLKLELNPKKSFIQPISHGIDFCQYRIFTDHIRLKKRTALRMKRNLKRIQRLYAEGKIDLDRANRTLASYKGLLAHCDSYQLGMSIFGEYSETEWTEGWFVLKRSTDNTDTEKHSE